MKIFIMWLEEVDSDYVIDVILFKSRKELMNHINSKGKITVIQEEHKYSDGEFEYTITSQEMDI